MSKADTGGEAILEETIKRELLIPDSIFAGKYRIISVLGKGGVGVVYKAQHIHIQRFVAIKTLHSSLDGSGAKRFRQEAQAASAVAHPNIVKVDDFGIEDGQAFLVLELLDGKTLDEVLDDGPIPVGRFLNIFIQATAAMQHAHEMGLVHRDIKCSNLMLVQTKEKADFLKIVDFGLAKMQDEKKDQHLTQSGTVLGSPLYMSPEQCRGFAADNRSDIYAIGCVMYRALTGNYPLMGENVLDTMSKHLQERPKDLTISNPSVYIPYRLQQLIMRMLEKDPAERPQTMQTIGETLKRMLPKASIAMDNPGTISKPIMAKPTVPAAEVTNSGSNVTRRSSYPGISLGTLRIIKWPLFALAVMAPLVMLSQGINSMKKSPHSSRMARFQKEAKQATQEIANADAIATTGRALPTDNSDANTTPASADTVTDTSASTTTEQPAEGATVTPAEDYYSQAQQARRQSDLPKAIVLLKESVNALMPSQSDKRAVILIEIGDCYGEQNDPTNARSYYEEAARSASPDSEVYREAASRLNSPQQ